jgi:flagellin
MLAIKNNLMAETAARHLSKSYDALSKSVERLSSGLRINSSKDDAAGLAVRELIRADVAQLKQGARNAQDGISMLQTAEGAMAVIDQILIRMKELAEQAATESYSTQQRTIINAEFGQLSDELTRIAQTTTFNSIQLLNSSETYSVHIGSEATIDIVAEVLDASALGLQITGGTKETLYADRGVTTADDDYVTAAEITDDGPDHFVFSVDLGAGVGGQVSGVRVDLGGYDATGVSLNGLIREVNTAWQLAASAETSGLQDTYIAYAYFDTDAMQYKLKLEAPIAAAGTITFSAGGSAIGLLDSATADWTVLADGSAGSSMSLGTVSGAVSALDSLTDAIVTKDGYRAKLGYLMNRLEAAIDILNIQSENLLAAESRVSDVDVATEMAQMTRNQVLAQAGISMLAQANTMPQMALTLLRG